MARGKGVKLIQIAAAKLKSREEVLKIILALPTGRSVKIVAGARHFTLKPRDLDAYRAERGKRGGKLPRGLQRVETLEVID